MPTPPRNGDAVLELVRKSELADDDVLTAFVERSGPLPPTAADTASRLVQAGVLTPFQARLILRGKYKGFRLGPYKILNPIGAGGMAQVYLAEHVWLRRQVALKVLPARYALDPADVQRFYREARAVAALDHPNIIRAHDVACDKDTHFLVLEYVDGQSLADKLASAGGRLRLGEACAYAVQAAAGLQHAHDKGLAHRDVTPGNLLVNRDGVVKILDLGLARYFQEHLDRPAQAGEGGVMGTADYIAPEQLIDCSRADHRADIYSLGATLYHLVTGQPPFTGTTTAKIVAHQLHAVPPAHTIRVDIPVKVSAIIARMMEKDPANRYQSAAEVITILLPFVVSTNRSNSSIDLSPIAAAAISQTTGQIAPHSYSGSWANLPLARPDRKRRLAFAGLMGTVLLAGTAIGAALLTRSTTPANTTSPELTPQPVEPKAIAAGLPRPVLILTGLTGVPEDTLFTADGARVVGSSAPSKQIRLWDAATGDDTDPLALPTESPGVRGMALQDSDRLMSCHPSDPNITLWDLKTHESVRKFTCDAPGFTAITALPGGCVLATATDKTVRFWKVDEKAEPERYNIAVDAHSVAATPDGKRFVVGCGDRTLRLWDREGNRELAQLSLTTVPTRLSLSPDSKWVATGNDKLLQLWHLETGETKTFAGPEQPIQCVAFTPDGQFVLAGSADCGLYLWEMPSGRSLGKVVQHGAAVRAVAVSPDSKRVATSSHDGTVVIWQMPTSTAK